MPTTLVEQPAVAADDDSAPLALLRATESFARSLRESGVHLARDADCSRATLALIRTLDQRGPLPVGDIAQILRVDISVASRQISLLADEGYVERQIDPDDRRVRTIALSAAGHVRNREITAAVERRTREAFAAWTPAAMHAAIDVLDRLVATIDAASDEQHHAHRHQPRTHTDLPTTPGRTNHPAPAGREPR